MVHPGNLNFQYIYNGRAPDIELKHIFDNILDRHGTMQIIKFLVDTSGSISAHYNRVINILRIFKTSMLSNSGSENILISRTDFNEHVTNNILTAGTSYTHHGSHFNRASFYAFLSPAHYSTEIGIKKMTSLYEAIVKSKENLAFFESDLIDLGISAAKYFIVLSDFDNTVDSFRFNIANARDSVDSMNSNGYKTIAIYLGTRVRLQPSQYPAINASTGKYLINPTTERTILLLR
jgi:hypothetical protein